jgi:pyruvate dehydrogenase E1 component alpha subunit
MKSRKILNVYKFFFLIRFVEERIAKEYTKWKMRCPTHLSVGQEMVSACISQIFSKSDNAVSSHRSHAHYIGKGGSLRALLCELYGKKNGCSNGLGGSMHLIDLKCNFQGSTAIVGNSIPVGVGQALAAKIFNHKNLSLIFFGDAGIETGVFYESVNFSILHNLPCIYICENNFYSVYTDLTSRQLTKPTISKRVEGLGIKSLRIDSSNWLKVFKTLVFAKMYVKTKKKPIFLEFLTYRKYEHVGPFLDDNLGYRPKKEILRWQRKDPLKKIKKYIINRKICSGANISKIEKNILNKINKDFLFAQNSKFPNKNDYKKYLFKKIL